MNEQHFERLAALSPARNSTGFLPLQLDKYLRGELRTSCSAEEEIFGAFGFYCDVEEAGRKLVHKLTGLEGEQRDHAYDLFQAFLRQGQTFFSSAGRLHHRASPLFHYYAFLNLAKAYISLRKPDLFSTPLKHGLSFRYEAHGDFNSQVVTVLEPGVFPELYELLIGQRIQNRSSFRIADLLGYLTDISFEYQDAGFGVPYVAPAKIRMFVNHKAEKLFDAWPVIVVGHQEKLAERSYALTTFLQFFEEVNLGKNECERIFKINAPDRGNYRFFQSRKTYNADDARNEIPSLQDDARKAVELLFMPNVFPDEEDFYFAIPMSDKPTVKMDEFVAGYLIVFYLGSLVRYHPDYLERILRSKEAWMIQRFTTSCATTLLRHASIFLLGQNRVLSSRA